MRSRSPTGSCNLSGARTAVSAVSAITGYGSPQLSPTMIALLRKLHFKIWAALVLIFWNAKKAITHTPRVSFLNAQPAIRNSLITAPHQVAPLKTLSPNLGSLQVASRLDVGVTHGTLRVAACASHRAACTIRAKRRSPAGGWTRPFAVDLPNGGAYVPVRQKKALRGRI
jgi:hypothetical protein